MAAMDGGTEHVASQPHSQRCSATNAKGDLCRAWAVVGSNPPLCHHHGMADHERRAQAARGGKGRARKARERRGLRDDGGNLVYVDRLTLAKAAQAVGRLLSSADVLEQALGLVGMSAVYRLSREQKTELLELIKRAVPPERVDELAERLADLEAARARLRQVVNEGRISTADLPPDILKKLKKE